VKEGGSLELTEAPFVRVRNERDSLMLEHICGRRNLIDPFGWIDFPGFDETLICYEFGKQT
jgi:hypothetical protein